MPPRSPCGDVVGATGFRFVDVLGATCQGQSLAHGGAKRALGVVGSGVGAPGDVAVGSDEQGAAVIDFA